MHVLGTAPAGSSVADACPWRARFATRGCRSRARAPQMGACGLAGSSCRILPSFGVIPLQIGPICANLNGGIGRGQVELPQRVRALGEIDTSTSGIGMPEGLLEGDQTPHANRPRRKTLTLFDCVPGSDFSRSRALPPFAFNTLAGNVAFVLVVVLVGVHWTAKRTDLAGACPQLRRVRVNCHRWPGSLFLGGPR